MNIFVASLDYGMTNEDLQDLFEDYGSVSSAKIIFDKFTGRSKGFGFVEMDDNQEATTAIEELNDSEVHGRRIVVKKAKPKNSSW
ncbi:RNA recognition motif domain-containing protein [Membranihabitans maritimus]|uniref:RNA recognition motif domain-containing protein n=1 Tax=Membranihabitans maritimus TaxID=2904244 RepID=UPI001F3E9A43|nr:RNA-binding protein [Membranihabitans maritimus]